MEIGDELRELKVTITQLKFWICRFAIQQKYFFYPLRVIVRSKGKGAFARVEYKINKRIDITKITGSSRSMKLQ